MNQLTALILDEGKWLSFSIGLAILAVILLLWSRRRSADPMSRRVLAAMNLYFGVMIGTMATGHLLAVTAKLGLGLLSGPSIGLYAIGIALAVPAGWLGYHTRRVLASDQHGRRTVSLNLWLAATLLALGLHNLPLAAPGLLSVWYHLNSSRLWGWVILTLFVVCSVGLFIASLVFLASGQTFEQFRGL